MASDGSWAKPGQDEGPSATPQAAASSDQPQPDQWATVFGLNRTPQRRFEQATSRFRSEPADQVPGGISSDKGDDTEKFMQLMQSTGDSSDDMMKMLMMWSMFKNGNAGGESSLETTGHRAFKRMHKMRSRPINNPEQVIVEYIDEAQEPLGVEAGDVWQIHQLTKAFS